MRMVVGVLRGGVNGYDSSLKSGANILEHIDRERYEPRDIFIDRTGVWHLHGLVVEPARALFGVDVAFNALEDTPEPLARLGVPYSGSTRLPADPYRLKQLVKSAGVRVPHSVAVERPANIEALAHQLFRTFPQPSVVAGRQAAHFGDFYAHLVEAFATAPKVYLEEDIIGRPASVGVVRHYRNEPLYATIPMPYDLVPAQKDEVVAMAKKIHHELNLGHYSQPEFVVGRRGVYFVGVSHPPLHQDSPFVEGLRAVGTSLKDFITHVIGLARR